MAKKSKNTLTGIAIGDLHLDKLSNVIPNFNYLAIQHLRKILEWAEEYGCDVAILLGDVFNYLNATHESQRLLLGLLVDFDKSPMKIRIIEGNHGYKKNGTGSLSTLALLEEYSILNTQFITSPSAENIKGVPLCYLPFPYTSIQNVFDKDTGAFRNLCVDSGVFSHEDFEYGDSLGAIYPDNLHETLGFGHFTRIGSTLDNGIKAKEGVEYSKKIDCKYYINGHLHTKQTVGKTEYPGSPYQTSFGESEDNVKGCTLFKAQFSDDKLKVKTQFKEFKPPFKLKTIRVEDGNDLKLLDSIESKPIGNTNYYRIIPSSNINLPKSIYSLPNVVVRDKPLDVTSKSNEEVGTSSIQFDLTKAIIDYLDDNGCDLDQKKMAKKLLKKALSTNSV